MKTNTKPPDYSQCTWTPEEHAKAILQCLALMGLFSYFFYRSAWAMLPLSLPGIWCYNHLKRKQIGRRREALLDQFRECILSVATLLQAGYSLENAFLRVRQEMEIVYGRDSDIYRELSFVRSGLHINIAIEDLLDEFARRSACKDITQFAQVVTIAKHSGGDMAEIMANTAKRIGRKIDLQKELQTALGGKRMELNVMKYIPFAILVYISIGNPGYFDVLYHNLTGIIFMTGCLVILLISVLVGEHFLNKIGEAMVLG